MAINFPDSPTTGQSFTVGDVTWVYDGAKWAGAGAVSAVENIYGGAAGNVLYQSGANDTAFTAAGTSGQVLLSGGTGSPTWSNTIAGATLTTSTLTSPTVNTPTLASPLFDQASREVVFTTGTGFAGYTFDVTTNDAVQFITANATSNGTVNFRSTSSVSLNTLMAVGQSLTAVLLITNGGTAYYPTAWQIDGSAVTPKWAGGTAPSAGNASSIDAYTVTIIKTASATYTVLASQTKYA